MNPGENTRRPPAWLLFYAAVWGIFLYAPVLLLPLFSFNDATIIAFPMQGFTTRWYQALPSFPGLTTALANSLIVASFVAPLSTLIGLLAAWAIVRYRPPGNGALLSFLMVPLVLPGVVLAVAVFMAIRLAGVPLSLWTVGLGHLVVCLPFAISVLLARLENFDRSLEEASRDLGEGAISTFRRVVMPLTAPGLVSSLLLTFTISFDEFVVSFFLTGSDTTLPVYLWSQLRFPQRLPVVLALGSIILLMSFVLVSVAERLRRPRHDA